MVADQQWSDEQMMEALQSGVDADAQPEQAPESAPVGETQQAQPAEVQPATPVAPEVQDTADLFDGTPINPDELPEELKPLAKQLQGVFTQKTQDVAELRKQFEALGDPAAVQEAVDLYHRITDPSNWQQLHSELTAAMQEYGLSPAEAAQAATEALATPAVESPAATPAVNLDELDDPELAPLVQMLKAQQAELDSLKGTEQQRQAAEQTAREEAQAEYQRQAYLGELQRQENTIRAAHPDWDDDVILSVYQMSSFFGGNLAPAAERVAAMKAAERELYLSEKAGVAAATGGAVPPRGAGSVTQQVTEHDTIRDAEAEATEFFLNRVAHYEGQ